MSKILSHVEKKLQNDRLIDFEEAIELSEASLKIEELFHLADTICKKHMGNKIDLCAIINAKSGKCAENCKYCAQSGYYNTGIPTYPLLDIQDVLALARENEKEGVHRFSIVTSGGNLSNDDFEKVLQIIVLLRLETNLKLCASLGSLSVSQALRLKEAGLSMYHHNIETCREYYANICDSHTYDDRIHTIKNAIKAGLTVCCGGIIGMGESMKQRIKMAFELRELGIRSIPINILTPIKGTPLEHVEKIEPLEILKTISLFRLIISDASIRYAGGRNALGELQRKGFMAGINGVMVGNYLTTVGNTVSNDVEMIREIGLELCR